MVGDNNQFHNVPGSSDYVDGSLFKPVFSQGRLDIVSQGRLPEEYRDCFEGDPDVGFENFSFVGFQRGVDCSSLRQGGRV